MADLEKVLLVDDDETTLILCEFILERYEVANEIYKCANGMEAISYFENFKEMQALGEYEELPKLIFLDLNMPVMSGWDFLEDLYKDFPDLVAETNVVILSSSIDPKDFERSLQYGVVADFIHKPLNQASISQPKNNPRLKRIFN